MKVEKLTPKELKAKIRKELVDKFVYFFFNTQ